MPPRKNSKNTTAPINPSIEIDEESFEQQETKPVKRNATRGDAERSPLNHAKDSATETIGGIQFRRQRHGLDHSSKSTLDINPALLNNELRYRWVNDSSGRIEKLRETGYETVDQASFSKGDEISTRRRVGTNKDGSALFAQLMATPKKWYDERQNINEESRRAKELGIASGKLDGSGEALDKSFYDKGTKIQS